MSPGKYRKARAEAVSSAHEAHARANPTVSAMIPERLGTPLSGFAKVDVESSSPAQKAKSVQVAADGAGERSPRGTTPVVVASPPRDRLEGPRRSLSISCLTRPPTCAIARRSWRWPQRAPPGVPELLGAVKRAVDLLPFVERDRFCQATQRGVRICAEGNRLRGAIETNNRLRVPSGRGRLAAGSRANN